jgi:hypothetical protein
MRGAAWKDTLMRNRTMGGLFGREYRSTNLRESDNPSSRYSSPATALQITGGFMFELQILIAGLMLGWVACSTMTGICITKNQIGWAVLWQTLGVACLVILFRASKLL